MALELHNNDDDFSMFNPLNMNFGGDNDNADDGEIGEVGEIGATNQRSLAGNGNNTTDISQNFGQTATLGKIFDFFCCLN